MKKIFSLIIFFLLASVFNGCLIFHKMSYTINLSGDTTGTAQVIVSDIRSDASIGPNLDADKKNLFEYIYKSPDFLSQMKDEGKIITDRQLFLNGDTLMGKTDFSFGSIFNVEKIQYQDGFYYLTLSLDDSVLTTNGQIIYSKDHKRILWDKSFKVLKFEMLGFPFKKNEYTSLSPFFRSLK
ncbi:MAG: hypothetical protein P4L35_18170 [Ignavibacteriaceae bacterium]|nr:hypothetical protein [Ignavibacteriaceae bacterium]